MIKAKILVIDDEEIMRVLLDKVLKDWGHEATLTSSGEEALKLFQPAKFELALVDFKMPGLDGIEVLTELKKRDPEIDIIIMTAHPTVENAIEALRQGAYDYIIKPFSVDELLLLTQRCLDQQRQKNRNIDLEKRLKKQLVLSKEIVREKTKELTLLYTIASTVVAGMNIAGVLQITTKELSKLLGTDRSTIYLVENNKLISWVAEGMDSKIEMQITEGITGRVVTTGKAHYTNDAYNDPGFNRHFDDKTGYRTKNLLTVPIFFKTKVIGVVHTLNKEAGLAKEDITKLTHLADQISLVIQRTKTEERSRRQNQELEKMLDALSKDLE